MALENLGGVYVKRGRPDAAEPLFRRALKIRRTRSAPNHAFSASGHANLGDVAWRAATGRRRSPPTARRSACWPARTPRRRSSSRSSTRRSSAIATPSSGCAAPPGRRDRDPAPTKAALVEETFAAAQHAWHTSAASALAKMTARLGAGDTELGRASARCRTCPTACSPCTPTTRSCSPTGARCSGRSGLQRALEEFRAASIARARDQAPTVKRQTELVAAADRLAASAARPARRRPAARQRPRTRGHRQGAGELSKAAARGRRRDHGRARAHGGGREGAARLSPSSPRGATALRDDIDRSEREATRRARADHQRLPDYAALADPKPLSVAEAQALLKADEALVVILVGSEQELRVGADARARRVGRDRRRQRQPWPST